MDQHRDSQQQGVTQSNKIGSDAEIRHPYQERGPYTMTVKPAITNHE